VLSDGTVVLGRAVSFAGIALLGDGVAVDAGAVAVLAHGVAVLGIPPDMVPT
jgi:hypothetical protein